MIGRKIIITSVCLKGGEQKHAPLFMPFLFEFVKNKLVNKEFFALTSYEMLMDYLL